MPKLSESVCWLSDCTQPLSERQQGRPLFSPHCSLLFVLAVRQGSNKDYTLKVKSSEGVLLKETFDTSTAGTLSVYVFVSFFHLSEWFCLSFATCVSV